MPLDTRSLVQKTGTFLLFRMMRDMVNFKKKSCKKWEHEKIFTFKGGSEVKKRLMVKKNACSKLAKKTLIRILLYSLFQCVISKFKARTTM